MDVLSIQWPQKHPRAMWRKALGGFSLWQPVHMCKHVLRYHWNPVQSDTVVVELDHLGIAERVVFV